MPQTTTPPGICRICSAHCGVLATVTDGKLTANTIDQPCKQVALAAHGHWLGGDVDFNEADSWMLIGTNPIVSKAIGIPGLICREPAGGAEIDYEIRIDGMADSGNLRPSQPRCMHR